MTVMADRKSAIYTLGQGLVSTAFRLVNPITRKDLDKLPDTGPVLVCCNHLSNKDPIVLGGVLHRQLYFMAKEELFHNALVGGVLRGLGAFPVHRGKGDEKALDTARELCGKGKSWPSLSKEPAAATANSSSPNPARPFWRTRCRYRWCPCASPAAGSSSPKPGSG